MKFTGAALLFISGMLAFGWFVWLAPAKHIFSQDWLKTHSKQAVWEEEQKSVSRIGVTHDVGIDIGWFGDKVWAAWIINHIKPGQNIEGCENSHLGEALADITNHQLQSKPEIWLAWWKTNQNKTQVEWIREGFAERNLVLQDPLTTNNIIDLLKLAHLATNSPAYLNTPDYLRGSLRMNAFRWLRDSGISCWDVLQIWSFDVNNIPEAERNRMSLALLDYAQWYRENYFAPDKLALQKDSGFTIYSGYGYESLMKKCNWGICFAVPTLAFFGIWLIRRHPPK